MIVYLTTTNASGDLLVIRRHEDGTEWWLGDRDQDAGYLSWLKEGNEPEEWKPK